jgi:hypothetical protein
MSITNLSVTLKSGHSDPAGEGLPFLQGIVGEWVMATIEFESEDIHDEVRLDVELAFNSESAYSYTDPLGGGYLQRYSGGLNTWLSPEAPVGWDFGYVRHESDVGHTYRLHHYFFINPLPLNGSTPEIYEGAESPKYAFQIELLYQGERTSLQTSAEVTQDGDVGYLGETFNQGAENWTLASTVNTDFGSNEGILEFVIQTSGSLPSPASISLHAASLLYGYDETLSLTNNHRYSFGYGLVDGQRYAGRNIDYFTATNEGGGQVRIRLKLDPGTFDGQEFVLWCVIGNYPTDEAASQRQGVLLHTFPRSSSAYFPDTPVVTLGQHPQAQHPGLAFFYHDDLARGFSDVKACVKDTLLARTRLVIDPAYAFRKLTVTIKNATQKFEQRVFLAGESSSRNYLLAPGDEFNTVLFDPATLDLEYAFRIRWEQWKDILSRNGVQDWSQAADIRFCLEAEVLKDGVAYQVEFQSPSFQLQDYLETIPEGGTEVNVATITTYNAITGANLDGNLDEQDDTEVVATFQGATAQGLDTPLEDLYGILSLDKEPTGGAAFLRQLFTLRPKGAGPFTEPFARLENYDLNTASGAGFGQIELKGRIAPGQVAGQGIVLAARLDRTKPAVRQRGYRAVDPYCVQGTAATAFRPVDPYCVQEKRFVGFRPLDSFCFEEGEQIPGTTGWRPINEYCVPCPAYGQFHQVVCVNDELFNEYHDGACGFFTNPIGCDPLGGGGTITGETTDGTRVPRQPIDGIQICDDLSAIIVEEDGKEYLRICGAYEAPFFTFFDIDSLPSQLEVGEIVTGGAVNFVFAIANEPNVEPDTVEIIDVTSGNVVLATGQPTTSPIVATIPTLQYFNHSDDHIFRIRAQDTQGNWFEREMRLTWLLRMFWGPSPLNFLTETDIEALANSALKENYTLTHEFAGGGYKFWAYPEEWGIAQTFTQLPLNYPASMARDAEGYPGFPAGHLLVPVTNPYGITRNYVVQRTKNTLGSAVTIRISP